MYVDLVIDESRFFADSYCEPHLRLQAFDLALEFVTIGCCFSVEMHEEGVLIRGRCARISEIFPN